MKLNEVTRLKPEEVTDKNAIEYWALYNDIYKMFLKIKDREELHDKYRMLLSILKPGRTRGALTFFYRLRRDEIDKEFDWEDTK